MHGDKLSILIVAPTLSPRRGGGPAVTNHLARALGSRGHKVTIYTSDLDLDLLEFPLGIKVYGFRSWLNLITLRLTPGIILTAGREIGGFDIIHMQGLRTFQNIVVYYYARKHKIPYIVDAHGLNPLVGRRWLKKWLDISFGYRILKNATRVIAETELGVKEYSAVGVEPDRTVLLFPPILTEEFANLPSAGLFKKELHATDKRIVMFLGRIQKLKGLDFLVESFSKVAQRKNDTLLVIVGPDDGYKSHIERMIENLGLSEKVLFTGYLGGEMKLSALVDADLVVQPSIYEQGLPLACVEALLCGTPIVVSRNTGAGEDVAKTDVGYSVEYGNEKELAEVMEKILDDPSEARDKVRIGQEYIETKLSLTKKVSDYEELYTKCIGK